MSTNALHDNLLAELQRGGLVPEGTAPPDPGMTATAPLDLGYVEKLASDVEGLLQGLPPEQDAPTVDVRDLLTQRLQQVKTASAAPSHDEDQGKERLLQKLAQVVPGVAPPPPETGRADQTRAIIASWATAVRESGGAR